MKKIKNIKKIILLLAICISILLIYTSTISKEEEENWILFRVRDIKNPTQVIWYEEDLLIVKDKEIKKLDIISRNLEHFDEIDENEIIAIYENEIVYVKFQNHIIQNIDEYATEIKILDKNRQEEIYSQEYHETIRPIRIKNNKIYFKDNYLNSPKRTYRGDFNSNEIEQIHIKKTTLTGDEYIEVLDKDGKQILEIPKENNIHFFEIDEHISKYALVDAKGYTWIYFKK